MYTNGLESIPPQKLPHTTYRIQFHKDFNFNNLEEILPYLHQLGIDTIYASPIMQSTPGSMHGYDGTDMNRIDPELGTIEDLRRIRKQLDIYGIKWLQDIVPNHMAFNTKNAWLMNLLEFGQASSYSNYFDTCFNTDKTEFFGPGKLMVPVLGEQLSHVIKENDILLERNGDRLVLRYFDNAYPLNPTSYISILEVPIKKIHTDFSGFMVQINTAEQNGNTDQWNILRKELLSAIDGAALDACISLINNSGEKLQELINAQFYEICPWWDTNNRINFRRFFTVNGLICINVHNSEVFSDAHRLIKELIDEGLIDGLRIDHIDGLYNPDQYLTDLRVLVGSDIYIVAEKILESSEQLPQTWPIQGTSGYDFLSQCNNLISCKKGEKKLDAFYKQLIGQQKSLKKLQIDKKTAILTQHMHGEVENLVVQLQQLLQDGNDVEKQPLKSVITFFLVHFPIYRIYDDRFPLSRSSYRQLSSIFKLMSTDSALDPRMVARVWNIFRTAQKGDNNNYQLKVARFLMRCMQFTGPVMAKGVEDTLMYTFNRYIGHNEVGDHPGNFGLSAQKFHKLMQHRQKFWPLSLNASSTHDTKRGEDARSRLAVLTAMSNKWVKQVEIWQDIAWNEYRKDLPHPNDEYFIYQALVSSYPYPVQKGEADREFEQRFLDYLIKYLREGKERSSWEKPNESYESAVQDFARFLLDKERPFFTSFYQFLQRIVDFGLVNTLVLQVLKFTSPGVPDIYQGSEMDNYSFVDPDNRRPVDYIFRHKLLDEINSIPEDQRLAALWNCRHDGRIKLWLVSMLTQLRCGSAALSANSSYIKLDVSGKYKDNIIAFARKSGEEWLLMILPVHLASLGKSAQVLADSFDWSDTQVHLPTTQAVQWKHLLAPLKGRDVNIAVGKIFVGLPLAVLTYRDTPKQRTGGILMHISSLPSSYGIGDMGKNARRFVDQLQASGQSWWQMLPLGPTVEAQYHSPYSTSSAWAGNPLFIDLEALANLDLLTKEELNELRIHESTEINFQQVCETKFHLLQKAYQRYVKAPSLNYAEFCLQEAGWLNDFAIFTLLKKEHGQMPWYEWPLTYRLRDQEALHAFENEHTAAIDHIKWMQYIFFFQWKELHQYCSDHGIRLLGDVPIYVNYDSVDVWANPQIFSLDNTGALLAVAGVPPDYFNDQGQLWGMPVYRWEILKQDNYRWWIERLCHNCKLFDRVRLDHFRAFSDYWEVPAKEITAKNGMWRKGPGSDFFDHVAAALHTMPFVAEDLGDVDTAVYELRDRYNLPGMKVLQFAFGDDMACSTHIPHQFGKNFVAYTGTHDNNTTLSWYNQDIDQRTRGLIDQYMGRSIEASTVNWAFIRCLYASVADTVIIPMQDILRLDGSCRMNRPASTNGNWIWRMAKHDFNLKNQKQLRHLTQLYNR